MNKETKGLGHAVLTGAIAVFLAWPRVDGAAVRGFLPDIVPPKTYQSLFQAAEGDRIQGEFERSALEFESALKIARETRNAGRESACLLKLGLLHWNQGRVPEAVKCFADGLEKAKTWGNKDIPPYIEEILLAIRLYNQGKDLRIAGRLPESAGAFDRALGVSRKIGSEDIAVKCLRQMSLTYWEMNDLKKFLSCNEDALLIARRLKLKREEGRCLNNIGLYHWKSTNYSAALWNFQEALQIVGSIKDDQTEAECLNNIGGTYLDLGEYDKALGYLRNSLSIDQEHGREANVSRVLNNMGVALERRGAVFSEKNDYLEALGYFNKSMSFLAKYKDVKTEIETLNNIGTIFSYLGDFQGAREKYGLALSKAIAQENQDAIGALYNNIGGLYFQEYAYITAKRYFKKAIEISLDPSFVNNLWEAYFGLGQCYEKTGENDKALCCYEKSAEIIDQIRSRIFLDSFKAGFARNKVNVFERLLNVLFLSGPSTPRRARLEKIFSVIERAKARAFLESLGEAKIDIKENLPPDMKLREADLTKEISSIFLDLAAQTLGSGERRTRIEKLGRAEDEYMRLISDMKLIAPDVANLVAPEIRPLKDIQNTLLDDKTGLVEYFLGEVKSYAFYVSKETAGVIEIESRAALERSLKGYLKAMMSPSGGDSARALAGERIAGEILRPIAGEIDHRIEKLIIIPDGILYYLPFETLRIPKADGSGREFLIEKYEVSYAPSASSLIYLTQRKPGFRSMSLLSIGDPAPLRVARGQRTTDPSGMDYLEEIYQGQGFNFKPLPFSRKEAIGIARHFPEADTRVLLGREAREDVLKKTPLKDFRIVHFACHGLIDEIVPFRSALVLSAGGSLNDDGFLQAREIYTLRLDADLVVLSACQTGKGTLEKGEGILGLPRMFFYAGAKSVISTLWPIQDRSTALFMDKFYGFLVKGHGRAEALRLAKLDMLSSKYRHPFYWAAFVLNGDSGPIFPRADQ
jgi:CHAT domain-containing protein/tetratricopeptide (TPR) repeat protein